MGNVSTKQHLIDVFSDTRQYFTKNHHLASSIVASIQGTRVYVPDEYPNICAEPKHQSNITVSKRRTFEAAILLKNKYQEDKVCVLNFASASNPGGGVLNGSSAQEESLCRCSTLFPTLNAPFVYEKFYCANRAKRDPLHNDACIYTPNVIVFKSDDDEYDQLPQDKWRKIDVISCSAPNLIERRRSIKSPDCVDHVLVGDNTLADIQLKRTKHILHIAACNGVDHLVLGAFGCGAFRNNPEIVARAFDKNLKEYSKYFKTIEFAIFCRPYKTENYDIFRSIIKNT